MVFQRELHANVKIDITLPKKVLVGFLCIGVANTLSTGVVENVLCDGTENKF